MFREDFAWGVASSAYQIEGRSKDDGAGACMWDMLCDAGRIFQGADAYTAIDEMHRYREDIELMRLMGVKNYRFSVSWSRIMPEGTGRVNEKGIALYRDMLRCMLDNGIKPYITMYHWELPQALSLRGGWLNREIVDWFGEYARVVAENFSDLCEDFITLNEPQCTIMLGYVSGEHAPGLKVTLKESFIAAHNLLMAHGQAVINLRKYAGRPIRVGFAPTCGVAYPYRDCPEDIEAARRVHFGFYNDADRWAWNVSWFCDPVVLGHYPEEGLQKFADYLPEYAKEDLELIHQPIDFLGQNIYNGYPVKAGENGNVEFPDRAPGYDHTDTGWPAVPESLYWGTRLIWERYALPMYITENGMACHDLVSPDGRVHDTDRITFLDSYIGALQRAVEDGADVRGYFLWTFLDNFEWAEGYSKRFGLVYVDMVTQQRIIKDSAYWYKDVMATNGATLTVNTRAEGLLFMEPTFSHTLWGGAKLAESFGYDEPGDDIGECWGISAHPQGDNRIKNGYYKGMVLSELWSGNRSLFGNVQGEVFPLLTKIISAKEDLSIQVHPDDAYAAANENGSLGKTEGWYVLDAEPGSQLVVGHNAKSREELESMIDSGRWDELIRRVDVAPGDFIQIEPGTLHAIGGGLTLLETQQNSDITYRLYDYDRDNGEGRRQLHITESKAVIRVPSGAESAVVMHDDSSEEVVKLLDCKYYELYRISCNDELTVDFDKPFLLVSVVDGSGVVDAHPVRKGTHFVVPAGYGKLHLLGSMKLIVSCLPDA